MDNTIIYPFSKWIKATKLEAINGYTYEAVKAKIKKGVWRNGVHWKHAPDGSIMVNPRAIHNWIDSDGME